MAAKKGTQVNLQIALALAKRGLRVFPCKARSKAPATQSGCKDATTDPKIVRTMFAKPDLNVAIATGPEIFFVDADGDAGCKALCGLMAQHGDLPQTIKVFTPGGGWHFGFLPNGTEVRNRTKIDGHPIDCRGTGGYVVTSPSVHPNGGRYLFDDDMSTQDDWHPEFQIEYANDQPIAEAPGWILGFVTSGKGKLHLAPSLSRTRTATKSTAERLETAPGATQGSRHDTALELIGREIGLGTPEHQVVQLAWEWGGRCSPPMDTPELLRIVRDLAEKHTQQPESNSTAVAAVAADDSLLDQPIPDPAPWPELDEAALYGLAGEIVRRIEPETESDPVAILAQLLVSFGNWVGRGPHFIVEGTSHHTNTSAVLVGSTSRGRKGTSGDRVRSVIQEVDPEWTADSIKSGLVSGEGLIWHVRDPIFKTEHIKEKGRIVGTQEVLADAGVEDKRLLVIETEFASVLRVCRRETNTLSPVLRSAWDSGHLRTLSKNSPAKATEAHVSLVGHITAEELGAALTETDSFNGFANRFLWVVVRRSKLLPDGGADLDLSHLSQRLALVAGQARSVGRMYRDRDATALWHQIYSELADDNPGGLLGAVTSRAEAQVLRFSMIYSLLDGSGTITGEHLTAALALWRYSRESAERIFGEVAADPVEDQVLAAITQAPGISRRDLHRALANHVKAAVLNTILVKLRDAGKIRQEKIETGGRPAEQWFPCTDSPQGDSSLNSLCSQVHEPSQQQEQGLNSLNSLCSQPMQDQTQPEAGKKELIRI